MPRQRELSYYGDIYEELLSRAFEEPQRLIFKSPEQARNQRRTLYNYRYAIRDAGHRELWKKFRLLQLTVTDNILTISIRPATIIEDVINGR